MSLTYPFSFRRLLIPLLLLLLCSTTLLAGKDKGTAARQSFGDGGLKEGPRSVENIEKNMKVLLPRLAHLYQKRLEDDSLFEGSIELHFEIDRKGVIANVTVGRMTFERPEFEDAVVQALYNHTFDAWKESKDITLVVFPIVFSRPHPEVPPRPYIKIGEE